MSDQNRADQPKARQTEQLEGMGQALQIVGFLWGVLGGIGGFIIAVQTEDVGRETSNPNIGLGIGIALSSVAVGLVIATFGTLARAYAENNART